MPANVLTLEDGLTRLTLAPQTGGSIVNWTALESGQPLLRASDDDALAAGTPRKLACYPLAPWSNRIGNGGFDTPDGWLALSPNSNNDALPIHGSAWQQAWDVSEQSDTHVCLQLDSQTPFAYQARLRYTLRDGQLSIELSTTHLDSRAAWHGLGLHPYLPRTPHTRLQTNAAQVWLCDEAGLPTELRDLPADWNFRHGNALPRSKLDNGFTGWDGRSVIRQPDLGYELHCEASGSEYFLVFCPQDLDFFCFEPVSHPVNAHHLPGHPGLKLLQHGESMTLGFSLLYRAL
ncbi:aldose 1-epimerase (plasmid) [Pseudomonas asturiensis]|uniref:Aldose 1-epimerase n=1 Tax=Pseudomonas asturiensis TaxID=1190415 RepID=A0ABX6HKW9_9PSED|nr:aldose 1-epimerase [Pseudomonas asturiensis]QHF05953.1 aldose 1-epimerase [Pseudomonas asturiensis]